MSDWFDKVTAVDIEDDVDNMEFEDAIDDHQYAYRFVVRIDTEYTQDCDKLTAARAMLRLNAVFEMTKEVSAYHITTSPLGLVYDFDYNSTSTMLAMYFVVSLKQALMNGIWLSYSLYRMNNSTIETELNLNEIPTSRNMKLDTRTIESHSEKLYHFFHVPGLDCKDAVFKLQNGKELSEWYAGKDIVSKHEWWDDSLYNYTYEYVTLKSDSWAVHAMKLLILCLLNERVVEKYDLDFPSKCMRGFSKEFDWSVPLLNSGFFEWAQKTSGKLFTSCNQLKRPTPKAVAKHISTQLNKITLKDLYKVRDSILFPEPGEYYDMSDYMDNPKLHLNR